MLDLDQTVIGNPAHDVICLALSLAMAARGSDLPGVTTARMPEHMMHGYEAAFAPEAEGETPDTEAAMPRTVRQVMRSAAGRSWKHLADERIEGDAPRIPLGRLRLAVLVAVDGGRVERHCLMDVKEAVQAAAPRTAGQEMPQHDGERPAAGVGSVRARAAAAGPKLEIERLSVEEAVKVAEFLAQVVGRGHARQMTRPDRERWLAELHRSRSASLDAPSWLWRSVVDLVASHEAVYLEHCRRWAMQPAQT